MGNWKGALVLLFVCVCPPPGDALALPSYTVAGTIQFDFTGGQQQVGFYPGQVSVASGGASDPIIGNYQTVYVPAHTSWDYVLVSKISPGVWSLSGGTETIVVTPSSGDWNNSSLYRLQAQATAQTIDFNTGTVTWGSATILSVNNAISSSTLQDFSSYSTGTLTMSFATSTALQGWAETPSGGLSSSYSSTLTGTPEPHVWLLWLTGLGLTGYALRLRQAVPAS
jgi:hypothetical protein